MNFMKKIIAGRQDIKENKIPAKDQFRIEILYSEIEKVLVEINNLKTQLIANRLFMLENRKEQILK